MAIFRRRAELEVRVEEAREASMAAQSVSDYLAMQVQDLESELEELDKDLEAQPRRLGAARAQPLVRQPEAPPQGPSCEYASNPNMDSCEQIAQYSARRTKRNCQGKSRWVLLCEKCKAWGVDTGSFDSASTDLNLEAKP